MVANIAGIVATRLDVWKMSIRNISVLQITVNYQYLSRIYRKIQSFLGQ